MPLDASLLTALTAAVTTVLTLILSKSKCLAELNEHGQLETFRVGFIDAPLPQSSGSSLPDHCRPAQETKESSI